MPSEAMQSVILAIATAGMVAISMFVCAFGAFVWARAMVKVANGQLVFRQLDEMGRPVPAHVVDEAPDRGKLPTRVRMSEMDEEDLRAAAAASSTVVYDQDPDSRPAERRRDDHVYTTDQNAGGEATEPPVPGTPLVRGR